MLAVDLVHRNDELNRVRVVGVGDGVVEDADAANDLANLLRGRDVRRVADNILALGNLFTSC